MLSKLGNIFLAILFTIASPCAYETNLKIIKEFN